MGSQEEKRQQRERQQILDAAAKEAELTTADTAIGLNPTLMLEDVRPENLYSEGHGK